MNTETKTQDQIDYEERQRRIEEKEEQQRAEHRATMDKLECAIAPLKFNPVGQWNEEEDPEHKRQAWRGYFHRSVLSESGEQLGIVAYRGAGYSWKHQMKFELSSARIPRSGRGYRQPTRRYKKFDSAVAAIKKFCIPVSGDEERAKVLRQELQHYRRVVSQAYSRSCTISGETYMTPRVDALIRLLASDIPQDYLEGQEFIRVLVRKRKVHNRFDAWVTETYIEPRQEELDSLDLSKEKVA